MSDTSTIGNIRVGASADTRAFVKGMKASASSMDMVATSAAKAGTTVNNLTFNRVTTSVGGLKAGIGGLATGLIALGGARIAGGVVKTAIDMEQAMVGLAKATDLAGPGLAAMKAELFGLSTELKGVKLDDIIAIATSGAKLGIATSDLKEYTRGIAMVSTAMDDIPADQIADSVGKINIVFKLGVKGAMQLGSAIDKLADSGASSASGIMDVTQRISGTAAAMKLAAPDAVALAAALLDTGTEAEAGAGALNALLQKMIQVDNAGDFADTIGISAEKFSKTLRDKPMEAITLFLAALKKMDAPTQFSVLDNLKFAEGRVIPNIQKLSQQTDILKGYAGQAAHEFVTLDQATKSYAATAETTGAMVVQTQNHLQIMADTVGQALLPAINSNLQAINESGGSATSSLASGIGVAADAVQMFNQTIKAGGALLVNLESMGVNAFLSITQWADKTLRKLSGMGEADYSSQDAFAASLKDAAMAANADLNKAASAPWASDAINKKLADSKAQANGLAKAMGGVGTASKSMGESVAESVETVGEQTAKLSKELKEQIATFGMTGAQALIYKLKLAGASEAQLASVKALDAQHKAMEKAKDITEEFTKPLDAYKKRISEIDALVATKSITPDVAARAKIGAKADLVSKTESSGPRSAAALEAGSVEARSAIINYKGADAKDEPAKETAKNTAKTVDLQTKMAGFLEKIATQTAASAGTTISKSLFGI